MMNLAQNKDIWVIILELSMVYDARIMTAYVHPNLLTAFIIIVLKICTI